MELNNTDSFLSSNNFYASSSSIKLLACLEIINTKTRPFIFVARNNAEGKSIYKKLRTLSDDVAFFPSWDCSIKSLRVPSIEIEASRVKCLKQIKDAPPSLIITTWHALTTYFKPLQTEKIITIDKSGYIVVHELRKKLKTAGFIEVDTVQDIGEFVIRGGIIDIFSCFYDNPLRFDLFGADIEFVYEFNPISQRNIEQKEDKSFQLYNPIKLTGTSYFDDLRKSNLTYFFKEIGCKYSSIIYNKQDLIELRDFVSMDDVLIFSDIDKELKERYCIVNDNFSNSDKNIVQHVSLDLNKGRTCLEQLLKNWDNVVIACENSMQLKFAKRALNKIEANNVSIEVLPIEETLFYQGKLLVPAFILGMAAGEKTLDKPKRVLYELNSFNIGDYLVHSDYGIGLYLGLKTISLPVSYPFKALKHGYLQLQYAGSDKLMLPVENVSKLTLYQRKSAGEIILDPLNSKSWARRYGKTKDKIMELASRMVAIEAKRKINKAPVYEIDAVKLQEFSEKCGFVETPDQLSAI